ncbi:NAD(P)H-binding protein [Kineosporia sp. J2-2]|uniref:NAD(P)H-binding protein n=1 Tax=Kineosporia corallincola TaxID=2835133 RepID=A0ABS5TT91_9ACTN|nr:NAD(P)H-binding protein [Kineosporia corallincola]MBT0774017.1 NAD(P)H-binding protein [Kineosporia corallincola]
MSRPIAVVGASGAVGRAAVTALLRLGAGPLRLGARDPGRLPRPQDATVIAVDVTDPHSLRTFLAGCAGVLDCSGPSYELGDAVPAAALAAGVPCVVVTGEQPVYESLIAREPTGPAGVQVPVVLSAGTLPGLSGLLPRLFAATVSGASAGTRDDATAAAGARLVVHTGGLEPCTATVGADLVLSLGVTSQAGTASPTGASANLFGEAGAAWRDGRRRSRVLAPAEDADVPGFPGRVGVQPFLSLEAERVAGDLGLRELDWYHVHPGPAVRAVLATLPAARHSGVPLEELVARIRRAADVDLTGQKPYYRMSFTLLRRDGSQTSVLLRSPDSYRLTGAVGACAMHQVLLREVPAGIHFADRVLDPRALLKQVQVADPDTRVDVVDGGAEDEEGAL